MCCFLFVDVVNMPSTKDRIKNNSSRKRGAIDKKSIGIKHNYLCVRIADWVSERVSSAIALMLGLAPVWCALGGVVWFSMLPSAGTKVWVFDKLYKRHCVAAVCSSAAVRLWLVVMSAWRIKSCKDTVGLPDINAIACWTAVLETLVLFRAHVYAEGLDFLCRIINSLLTLPFKIQGIAVQLVFVRTKKAVLILFDG